VSRSDRIFTPGTYNRKSLGDISIPEVDLNTSCLLFAADESGEPGRDMPISAIPFRSDAAWWHP
jgi:hypothetical protein